MGTPRYMVPEVWRDLKYIKANDVYSFSLIVYEILTNEIPLKEFVEQNTIIYQICHIKYRPPFNVPIPKCYQKLIESCWSDDLEMRPTFDEIVNLLNTDPDFISNINDFDDIIYYSELVNEKFTSIKSITPKQKDKVIKKVSISSSSEKINELTISNLS